MIFFAAAFFSLFFILVIELSGYISHEFKQAFKENDKDFFEGFNFQTLFKLFYSVSSSTLSCFMMIYLIINSRYAETNWLLWFYGIDVLFTSSLLLFHFNKEYALYLYTNLPYPYIFLFQ